MIQFSIVIPSHGRADLLERLLASIQAQTFRDFEIIVVDDASPHRDGYEAVLARQPAGASIRYLRNAENRGAQYSRNRGVSASRGEWIAFVDDDDEWLPRKLELQAALVRASPQQLGVAYGWADAVREDGREVVHAYRSATRGAVLAMLLDACFIPSPTVIVRRAALDAVGPFDEALPSCQDWDMWTRIAAAGWEFDLVPRVVALNHKHGRASIGTSPRRLQGFFLFYEKHAALYEREGMARNLSEKHRALARQASLAEDRQLAAAALRRSLAHWTGNAKAWVRYAQLVLRMGR